MQRQPLSEQQAQERAEQLCARAEYCIDDISTRLRRWGLDPAAAGRVVSSLLRGRFIDQERFAQAFARDKVLYSGWGRAKIAAALRAKRVEQQVIALALESLDPEDYANMMTQVLQAKARGLDMAVAGDRMKVMRFAASRGFEAAQAAAILRSLCG